MTETKIVQKETKSNSETQKTTGKQPVITINEYPVNNRLFRTDNDQFSSPLLDTSAQLRTDHPKKSLESLTRRAKAKFITSGLIFPLIDLHSSLEKSYWRTWHCTSEILQDGQKLTSRYCNNRWCIVCNRIRTAKMIEKYYPVIKSEIEDPYFVTLTIPNVQGQRLRQVFDNEILNFRRISEKIRIRDKVKLKGIRKLECTYNPERGDFHPHGHILIEGEKSARLFLNEWLKHYPKANEYAQDIRPADDDSILELLKYVSKLVDKKDYSRKDGMVEIRIHAEALDTIFRALYRRRVYQGFGIRLNLNEDIDELQSEVYDEILSGEDVWRWEQESSDWVSTYGELLTGCDANKIYKVIQSFSGC